jgi:hypothetical protein
MKTTRRIKERGKSRKGIVVRTIIGVVITYHCILYFHPTDYRAHGLINNIISKIVLYYHPHEPKTNFEIQILNTNLDKYKFSISLLLVFKLYSVYLLMEGSTLATLYYDLWLW